MTIWQGRLSGELHALADEYNRSLPVDRRLIKEDLEGSIAHVEMLAKQDIIGRDDGALLVAELSRMFAEASSGALEIDEGSEDIHSFIEQELTRRLGEVGKKVHTGRSRNDQTALALKLWLKRQIEVTVSLLESVVLSLIDRAERAADLIMPGYTHLQAAQPVSVGHYLLSYAWMFIRDRERFLDLKVRVDRMPLGAAALAGTSFPLDRHAVRERLGFSELSLNSMDAVSDRDHVIEYQAAAAISMMHVSRLAEDLIIYASPGYRFISFSDAFSTGSSIMPQKKNPDLAELMRGKTARVYGNLMQSLTLMKALPMTYNKDMQEDKASLFDSVDTLQSTLALLTPMLESLTFHEEQMRSACRDGFLNATDCADYLVRKGLSFREAYKVTGELVQKASDASVTLESLDLFTFKHAHPLFDSDIYDAIDLDRCLLARETEGGPGKHAFSLQVEAARAALLK